MPGAKFADWLELKRFYIDRARERGDFFARTYPEPTGENAALLRRQIALQFRLKLRRGRGIKPSVQRNGKF